jgi:hypothetical protein
MEVASLSENLLFTTVRIDTISKEGAKGSGTGFLFTHKYNGRDYPFIVTNKHVINEADKGGITFVKKDGLTPKLGDAFRVNFDGFEAQWFGHPDHNIDISVTPLIPLVNFIKKNGSDIFYKTIATENIPNEEQQKELDAFEEIIFIGYPNGIWDSKNYLPIMRKGTTATPLAIDFENEKKFLIDASVFGGSSGSPVFIYQTGAYGTKNGPAKIGTKFFFVGVVAAVYFKTEAHDIISLPIPTNMKNYALGKEMIDLGIVLKAETVVEAIENAINKLQA